MSGHFELMDLASGNLVGDYDTQDDALEVVRQSLMRDGIQAVEQLGLASVDGSEIVLIATNDELLALAADATKRALP